VALLVRREETLIAVVNFFGLPLTFLSTAFMASALMPGWLRAIARFNPVNWAVEGARHAMAGAQWQLVGIDVLSLAMFALVGSWLATQSFRLYRRSA
jgi:ABC-2 type transport system permease protein